MASDSILLILGPTAVGKSAVALRLAERLGGEIVSADSRQVYRGMDIGTAKPSAAERARVPHHLIDILDPNERFSAGLFRDLALAAISDIVARGKRPIVVGGTSLYIKALLGDYELSSVPPDPDYRAALLAEEAAEPGTLHRRLSEVEPTAASHLSPRDLPRLVRALELSRSDGSRPVPSGSHPANDCHCEESPTKQPVLGRAQNGIPQFPIPNSQFLTFALTASRPYVHRRINARVDAMFAAGLVEEVRALLCKYPPESPGFTSPGYRELIAFLTRTRPLHTQRPGASVQEPPSSETAARALIQRNTRRFAKRQLTWMKQFDYVGVDIERLGESAAADFILRSL